MDAPSTCGPTATTRICAALWSTGRRARSWVSPEGARRTISSDRMEPQTGSRRLDFGCNTNGCPFDRAEDAPADCSRSIEHRDAVRVLGMDPQFHSDEDGRYLTPRVIDALGVLQRADSEGRTDA